MSNLPQAPFPGNVAVPESVNRMNGEGTKEAMPTVGVRLWGVHPSELDQGSTGGLMPKTEVPIQAGAGEPAQMATTEVAQQVPTEQTSAIVSEAVSPESRNSLTEGDLTTKASVVPVARVEAHQPIENVSSSVIVGDLFDAMANDAKYNVGSAEEVVGSGAEAPVVK